jgi:hypothetical protein
MDLVCLAPREASIFACLVDAVAAPEPLLPPVAQTDCAFAFDRWMAASPAIHSPWATAAASGGFPSRSACAS